MHWLTLTYSMFFNRTWICSQLRQRSSSQKADGFSAERRLAGSLA
jgi:hypothetical protein